MIPPSIKFPLLSIILGLLTFSFSLPLYFEKLKMNTTIGLKLKKAYESEENWGKIHKLCGKLYIITSLIMIIVGILMFNNVIPNTYPIKQLFKIAYLVLFVYPIIACFLYSKKL